MSDPNIRTVTLPCFSDYEITFTVSRSDFEAVAVKLATSSTVTPQISPFLRKSFVSKDKEMYDDVVNFASSDEPGFEMNIFNELTTELIPEINLNPKWDAENLTVIVEGVNLSFNVSQQVFEKLQISLGKKPNPNTLHNALLKSSSDEKAFLKLTSKNWGLNGQILQVMSERYTGKGDRQAKKFRR